MRARSVDKTLGKGSLTGEGPKNAVRSHRRPERTNDRLIQPLRLPVHNPEAPSPTSRGPHRMPTIFWSCSSIQVMLRPLATPLRGISVQWCRSPCEWPFASTDLRFPPDMARLARLDSLGSGGHQATARTAVACPAEGIASECDAAKARQGPPSEPLSLRHPRPQSGGFLRNEAVSGVSWPDRTRRR